MAEVSYFFDAVAGDRAYSSAQMADFIDQLMNSKSGVIVSQGNGLAVTAPGSFVAAVNTGTCVLGGQLYKNTASLNLSLPAVASGLKRIDLIVIRFDAVTARAANAVSIQGTAIAGSPTAPTALATDLVLAQILIDNQTVPGTPSYTVTDLRTLRSSGADLSMSIDNRLTTGGSRTETLLPLAIGQTNIIVWDIQNTSGTWSGPTIALPAGGTYSFAMGVNAVSSGGIQSAASNTWTAIFSGGAVAGGSTAGGYPTTLGSGFTFKYFGFIKRIS